MKISRRTLAKTAAVSAAAAVLRPSQAFASPAITGETWEQRHQLSPPTVPNISISRSGVTADQVPCRTPFGIPICDRFSNTSLVALTFDDGPYPGVSEPLLEYLVNEQIPATFFLLAQRVPRMKSFVRDLVAANMAIGNHSFGGLSPDADIGTEHRLLRCLTPDQIRKDIKTSHDIISEACGREPTLFRPPESAIPGQPEGAPGRGAECENPPEGTTTEEQAAAVWETLHELHYERVCLFTGAFQDFTSPAWSASRLYTELGSAIENWAGTWFLGHDWIKGEIAHAGITKASYVNRMLNVVALIRNRVQNTHYNLALNFVKLD
jgi:peptidoglycan/xylan/chitin deacetylase (PgdA/CDA1 family)